jgi:DNA mismatch repair ATPase MutS
MVTLSNGMLTRPQFNSAGAIAIEKGRHPLETMVTSEHFIPNDCFLTEECCMKILHGPNMSGKSTYLRQVALLTIMAHTGSFVPAVRSSFGNIDRIFTRIGTSGKSKLTFTRTSFQQITAGTFEVLLTPRTSDDMEANASTFMLEMVEVQNILQNCTCQSLAIIDELGRGTSSSDGVGIAWSVSEYLIGTGVLTLFATHFLQLLQLENIYIQCKVMFLQYDVSSKDIHYKYIMKEGRKEDDGYGIKTARAAGFPESVLADAERSRSAVMRFNGELQSAQV